jgi:hypothetical protein
MVSARIMHWSHSVSLRRTVTTECRTRTAERTVASRESRSAMHQFISCRTSSVATPNSSTAVAIQPSVSASTCKHQTRPKMASACHIIVWQHSTPSKCSRSANATQWFGHHLGTLVHYCLLVKLCGHKLRTHSLCQQREQLARCCLQLWV